MNDCLEEVDQATNRLFYWGAYADKYGGQVQETTLYGATVCIREPVGVVAIACPDEKPLLSFVSLIAPAIVRSNAVIVIPSEKNPIPGMIQFLTSGFESPTGSERLTNGKRPFSNQYRIIESP